MLQFVGDNDTFFSYLGTIRSVQVNRPDSRK
jgi:hypothetical protein